MKTINSLSGGKTSSYLAVHYPADFNIFALIRTNDKSCMFPDAKLRQVVSDRIGHEFIGTLEEDEIIYTMLDLEQYLGKEIIWLSNTTFEDVINKTNGYLPNVMVRYCTVKMKVEPIAQWCYENTDLPVEMRIGFRANEISRATRMLEREIEGLENGYGLGEVCEALACAVGQIAPNPCYVSVIFLNFLCDGNRTI